MKRSLIALCVLLTLLPVSIANAEMSPSQRAELMLNARDICVGVLAKFVSVKDSNAITSFDQGKFKVSNNKGNLTVFEDNVKIVELPSFNYKDYSVCIEKLTNVK